MVMSCTGLHHCLHFVLVRCVRKVRVALVDTATSDGVAAKAGGSAERALGMTKRPGHGSEKLESDGPVGKAWDFFWLWNMV